MGFNSVLQKMFPFIATALSLGGPFGVMAANAIAPAIGATNLEPSVDGITNAIAAATSKDPGTFERLQQAEKDFQVTMAKLGFDSIEKLAELDAADRANARAREIAVKDKIPAALAIGVTAGFFTLLGIFAFHDIPTTSQTILNVLIGSLGTAWIGIVNYYFGSSSGSAKKTDIMAQEAKK